MSKKNSPKDIERVVVEQVVTSFLAVAIAQEIQKRFPDAESLFMGCHWKNGGWKKVPQRLVAKIEGLNIAGFDRGKSVG